MDAQLEQLGEGIAVCMQGCTCPWPQQTAAWTGQQRRNHSWDPVQRAMPWFLRHSVSLFLLSVHCSCCFCVLLVSAARQLRSPESQYLFGFKQARIHLTSRQSTAPCPPRACESLPVDGPFLLPPRQREGRTGLGSYRNPSKACVTGDSCSLQRHSWERGDRVTPRLRLSARPSTLLSNPALADATAPRCCCAPGPGNKRKAAHK